MSARVLSPDQSTRYGSAWLGLGAAHRYMRYRPPAGSIKYKVVGPVLRGVTSGAVLAAYSASVQPGPTSRHGTSARVPTWPAPSSMRCSAAVTRTAFAWAAAPPDACAAQPLAASAVSAIPTGNTALKRRFPCTLTFMTSSTVLAAQRIGTCRTVDADRHGMVGRHAREVPDPARADGGTLSCLARFGA